MSEQRALQKIECLVGGVHSWRGLQRIVSAYQAWRGHLRVRVLVPAQHSWTGTALGVLRYEALTEAEVLHVSEERVVEVLVQREDDHSTAGSSSNTCKRWRFCGEPLSAAAPGAPGGDR